MGIYNCADTLREAIDSLYAQTYKDFKIIICDDGSSDDSFQIVQEYAERYDNIVLLKNDCNRGLNFTLNRCIEFADTEFCARMDGDDISLPERFERELKFLDQNHEYAVVSTPCMHFDEDEVFMVGNGHGEVFKNDFIRRSPIAHAPCMIRTEVLKEVGGYTVSDKLLRVEDYHLWFKIFAAGYKLYQMPESLYMMRDSNQAATRRTWKNRKNEYYVKKVGYKMIGIPWYYYVFTFEPLILYLLPMPIYNFLHKRKMLTKK